jgi:hypothetical protein
MCAGSRRTHCSSKKGEMIPDYIIEQMESEWEKASTRTENFMQEIENAPFSESIKTKMIMALELTIELLAENEKLQREIKKLLKKKKK